HGDGLHATAAVAAGVGGDPSAGDDLRATAGVAHAVAVGDGNGAAGVLDGGHAGDVGRRSGRTFERDVCGAGDARRRGVADSDSLDAVGAVAAGVNSRPGPRGDFTATAGIAHAVAVTHDHRTAAIGCGGYTGQVSRGGGGAFEHRVGRADQCRRRGVADGDGLDAAGAVAAGVGGDPSAGDDLRAPAGVAHAVAVGDGNGAAGVLGGGHAGGTGARVGRAFQRQ